MQRQPFWKQLALFPMFYLFLICYVTVHVLFEVNFWSMPDSTVFDKYATAAGTLSAMDIAERVYFTKATWCVLLIVLQAFGLRFYTALALSFLVYGVELLAFFPLRGYAVLNLLLAIGMVIEVYVRRDEQGPFGLLTAKSAPAR